LAASSDRAKNLERLPALSLPRALSGPLEGKVGAVTGASHGIGAATAMAFAKAGADVVVAARREESLKAVSKSIASSSEHEPLAVSTGVTDESSVRRLIDLTPERFGRLDVAFNDAGERPHAWTALRRKRRPERAVRGSGK
jgi:NADP-dependent 3-hydroxy acid dehydrogenase YdfG